MGAVHQLYPSATPAATELPACIVLTPEFASKLRALNELGRSLRAAGVQVNSTDLASNTITIGAESVDLLATHFGGQMRGLMSRAEGSVSRLRTTVRGVDVVWFVALKEQDR